MTSDTRPTVDRSAQTRSWAPAGIGDAQIRVALGLAMVASVVLGLWFSRDTSFWYDELDWFSTTPDFDLEYVFEPYIGHLIGTSRIVYAAALNVFGGADYLPFRVLTAGVVLLTAGLFFVFAKRRVGALVALAPTLVLLFYGSDSLHVLSGNGLTVLLSVAAGVGALIALDRGRPRSDLGACLLLCLAVGSYSEGLPFVAGAAVLILLGPDRRRRAWVFVLPALLYVAWWAWANAGAESTTESNVAISNLLLAPDWALNSLASIGAAVTGLGYAFGGVGSFDPAWGVLVAFAALVVLGWRLSRGDVPRWLWATMAVPATFWLLHATAASPGAARGPENPRYLFAGTVAVLLVAAEAARGVRLGRGAIIALYAAAAVGIATNIALLRDRSEDYANQASQRLANLTAAELAGRVGVVAGVRLTGTVMREVGQTNVTTGYLEAARELGSPAFSVPELREQHDLIRSSADQALADGLGLGLEASTARPVECRRATRERGGRTVFELPREGAVLRTNDGPAPLRLRRFGTEFAVEAGELQPGVPTLLSIPPDAAPDPWYAETPAAAVRVCDASVGGES